MDKFDPVTSRSNEEHAEEALGELMYRVAMARLILRWPSTLSMQLLWGSYPPPRTENFTATALGTACNVLRVTEHCATWGPSKDRPPLLWRGQRFVTERRCHPRLNCRRAWET